MNIKDYIWKKTFKPEEFYHRILNKDYPKNYEDVGLFIHNIFLCHEYSDELIKDCVTTIDELKKNNFDFINMEYTIVFVLSKIIGYDYESLFNFYKKTFINKEYRDFYHIWNELNRRLLKDYSASSVDNYMALALLLILYNTTVIAIKDLYRYHEYGDILFATNVLKALTIKFWIDNRRNLEELERYVKESILTDSFIDKCSLKGIDTTSQSFQLIDYTATLIYNHEFDNVKKKIIE